MSNGNRQPGDAHPFGVLGASYDRLIGRVERLEEFAQDFARTGLAVDALSERLDALETPANERLEAIARERDEAQRRVSELRRALLRLEEICDGAESCGTEVEDIQISAERVMSLRARIAELENQRGAAE